MTTPVRHFQRLAFRAERRAYKRYATVLNVNSRVLCYQAKHRLANSWLKHYGLVEAVHPTHPPVTLAQYTTRCMLAHTVESNAATGRVSLSSLAEGVMFVFFAFTNASLCW